MNLIPYPDARREIRDADLLLFRPRGLLWRAVAVAGRSQYTHAAIVGRWKNRLLCVEMTSGGGRAQLLSNLVDKWPGAIDVYQSNAARRRFSREKTLNAMIGITGKRYGWLNLARAALLHLPLCRLLVRPSTDDHELSSLPPFCSQAVSIACRTGGIDPVPNLADRLTEPADLARSTFFKYRFTLISPRPLAGTTKWPGVRALPLSPRPLAGEGPGVRADNCHPSSTFQGNQS